MKIKLDSGETASVEIIPRTEAIDTARQPAGRPAYLVWAQLRKAPYRVSRGPGGAVDLVNYGLRVDGKCRAVARVGPAPWGNTPTVAAVGASLASRPT